MTTKQRKYFRDAIADAEANGNTELAQQLRYDRNCVSRDNRNKEHETPETWLATNERLQNNREQGTGQEAANRQALQDHVGTTLEDNNAGDVDIENNTRPDMLGDGVVADSKHFVTDNPDNGQVVSNTDQMKNQRAVADKNGATHYVVVSSENPDLTANPPRPKPTGPLGESESEVLFAQPVDSGNGPVQTVTHRWNNDKNRWDPV